MTMIDRDPEPIELAIDWLLHSVACELENDEVEIIRTEIIPQALQQFRSMLEYIKQLERKIEVMEQESAF
jgi:hypothetical protein